ncbi:amidophosphoribosyltransferase, partial [Bacillus paranthracis]|nr:amidophosphoribosyltransferase [Bacillus paranthracis]
IKRCTKDSLIESVKEALNKVKGAFAYLLLTGNEMIVALDPNEFRPHSMGKMGDAYVAASETCAMVVVGATYIRNGEPGELIIINDDGINV